MVFSWAVFFTLFQFYGIILKRSLKNYRLTFFLTVSLIFLPVISSAKQPAKEVRSAAGKENPAVEREPAYLPNENDVKSFVYRWFSWLDHQVADFLFLYHLSKEDLVMKFLETDTAQPR